MVSVFFMKISTKQFNYFVKECKKRVSDFGLSGWDITYTLEDGMQSLAECRTKIPQEAATISLSSDWKSYKKVTKQDLRITANHEMCHLLVARLDCIGRCRFVSESEAEEANEQIANSLVHFMRLHKII